MTISGSPWVHGSMGPKWVQIHGSMGPNPWVQSMGPNLWVQIHGSMGPKIWNNLPNDLKSSETLSKFKNIIKRYEGIEQILLLYKNYKLKKKFHHFRIFYYVNTKKFSRF